MQGEPDDAFARFVTEHRGAVTRYARRRVGADDVADVVADTFAVAWRRWDVAARAGLPWLYRAAALHVQSLRRSQVRRARLAERLDGLAGVGGGEIDRPALDRVVVASALERLSDTDREVLQLTYWEDLPVAGLARVLGCTSATAAMRLHRARRRLRGHALALGLEPDDAAPEGAGDTVTQRTAQGSGTGTRLRAVDGTGDEAEVAG